MGRNHLGTLPKITVHPRSGHARVRYNGKEIWLGKHGSPEAQQKYDRLIHEIVSSRLQIKTPSVRTPVTPKQPAQNPAVKKTSVEELTLNPSTQPTPITVAEVLDVLETSIDDASVVDPSNTAPKVELSVRPALIEANPV